MDNITNNMLRLLESINSGIENINKTLDMMYESMELNDDVNQITFTPDIHNISIEEDDMESDDVHKNYLDSLTSTGYDPYNGLYRTIIHCVRDIDNSIVTRIATIDELDLSFMSYQQIRSVSFIDDSSVFDIIDPYIRQTANNMTYHLINNDTIKECNFNYNDRNVYIEEYDCYSIDHEKTMKDTANKILNMTLSEASSYKISILDEMKEYVSDTSHDGPPTKKLALYLTLLSKFI